ncbi:MAG: arsenate reductase (glutaredoxin) [Steroidobacteraceae bacterium]|nr:arsenate reductase (glutaredoxin) [Steroidobacteraceae bacterium]MCW5572070.1 arsenate reductase (glutaredoxin) [Steroidobacteraceae bacterium]
MDATIWHNPACSTSRSVLAMLEHAGIQPTIVEYLRTPPSRAELAELIRAAGIGVRGAMRQKDALYRELGLADPALGDAKLLDAMAEHPALINRPFVRTPLGTRLCRPKELLYEILPAIGGL